MKLRNLAVAVLMPVIMLTGCSEKQEEMKDPLPSEITYAIMTEIEIPSAVEKTKENIGAYYDIDIDSVEELSVYICGSGAYPDELAVFKMTSEEQTEAAKDAVQKRFDSQIELYTDYTPDEMYKLDGARVEVKGKYVMFFSCSDDDRAYEIAEGLF